MTKPAAVVAALGVGALLLTTAACGTGHSTDRKAFDPPNGRNGALTIDSDNGDVVLTSTGGDRIQVTRATTGNPDVDWRLDGSTLRLTTDCGIVAIDCGANYTVAVPKHLAVTLTSTNGDLTARTPNANLRARDTNGDVRVENPAGAVSVTSTNGDIDVTGSRPFASLTLRSTNGDVTVRAPRAGRTYRIHQRTTNGDASSQLRDDTASRYSIDMSSVNGDLEVRAG